MTPEQIAQEKAEKEATKVIVDQAHKSISKAVKSCRDKLKEFLDRDGSGLDDTIMLFCKMNFSF